MIPTEHKAEVIQAGTSFMRAIMKAYGSSEGEKMWESITNSIDSDIKGQILFAALTGEYDQTISIFGCTMNDRLGQIRALRTVGNLGLKEAKDLGDMIREGTGPITVKCDAGKRAEALYELRSAGFDV